MDQNITPQNARISMPSKGRLMEDTRALFADCGISVRQENPRQYETHIPNMPGVSVLFQRPADIVISVRDGSLDFGITGLDVVKERRGDNDHVMVLHDALGFGGCMLSLAIDEVVEFAPGTRFYSNPEDGESYIRLNFASVNVEEIEEGILRLKNALRKLEDKNS